MDENLPHLPQCAYLNIICGREPENIALYESVIKINSEQFWFFAAVDPESNKFIHSVLYAHRTTIATEMYLRELLEKHRIDDADFFVDGAPWLLAGFRELGTHFRHETIGDRNPVERFLQYIKIDQIILL